jgi:hypothetical protein
MLKNKIEFQNVQNALSLSRKRTPYKVEFAENAKRSDFRDADGRRAVFLFVSFVCVFQRAHVPRGVPICTSQPAARRHSLRCARRAVHALHTPAIAIDSLLWSGEQAPRIVLWRI